MQNEVKQNTTEQLAPGVSTDFLIGSTEIGLDRIRTRLLDLTNRNKLLNFKHSKASSLRIVNVASDLVFVKLRDGDKLSFLPVPDSDVHFKEMPAKDWAEALGWSTSFNLDDVNCGDASALPVLHYQEAFDTISRKIAAAAKTAIEESGANMLYLVFGFLEWYESDDSQQAHLAPLVAVPVTMDRAGNKGKVIDTVLEHSGEDTQTNLSLVEKMRRDFGIEIPFLEEEETPEIYFAKFADLLKLKKRWRLHRCMTLALLSFGKLLMYRDLDPGTWPASESIAKHPLVRALFEGLKHPHVHHAEEYAIDTPELKEHVPQLIYDADSSQHSALIHALRGQNLVIEGPPGTGKSQTITNLIAAALAKGKTVLFVSEKLAALEVVRKRLDNAGLGVFCLEVHSHKTKKGALLSDLAERYKLRGKFQDPRDLDLHVSIIEQKKQLLTRYASLINKVIQPFNASIFEILWARDRHDQEIAAYRERLGQLFLPILVQYTQTDFTQSEQFLSVYAQHVSVVLASCDAVDHHPWAWITMPLSFEEEEYLLGALESFRALVRQAEECCKHLQANGGIVLARTASGLEAATEILAHLPMPSGTLAGNLLTACQSPSTRQKLECFVGHVESYRVGMEKLELFTNDVSSLMTNDANEALSTMPDQLRRHGFDELAIAKIREVLKATSANAKLLADGLSSFHVLLSMIGCDIPATFLASTYLLETFKIVKNAPFETLRFRQSAFESEHVKPLLRTARQEASNLKDDGARLRREFDLSLNSAMYTSAQLLQFAFILDEASLWQRLFGRDYKSAVKAYQLLSVGKAKASRRDMSLALRSVAEYTQRHALFDSHSTYREILGPYFKGVNSPWEELNELLLWYEQVFVALPEHQAEAEPFRRFILTASLQQLRAINANAGAVQEYSASLSHVVRRVEDFTRSTPGKRLLTMPSSFEELLTSLHTLIVELIDVLSSIDKYGIHDTVPIGSLPNSLTIARQCRDAQSAIESASEMQGLIGHNYCGVETEVEIIKRTVRFASLITSNSLPAETIGWLLCKEYDERLSELRAWLSKAGQCATALRKMAERLETLSGSHLRSTATDSPWGTLSALIEHALARPYELQQWNHFLRVQIKSKEISLNRLTTLADAGILEPLDLARAFHFVFYNTLARSIFTEHPDLAQVTGITQDLLCQQFASSDKEAIHLYSERVAAIIDKRPLPYGNQSGPVRTWTEMALLNHEISKQKRHIPIRQLMQRSANALIALKPCFMMGPLSVAQYLVPGQLKFDLVVMDEASQLKPEDAIGALARGSQVVIVGDPMQLPPTNFFQRVSLEDEDENDSEERTAVEEGESILDVASTLFQPVRRLRWHYRSRHHSLIAFSNEEFYRRDLIIFPSAYHDDASLGIKYRFVSDGVFESSRNAPEAAVVVEAVLEHMRQNPHESLGIVTLNAEQRELIEELLDRNLREDPAAIAYQEKMTGGQDTLFIKNLENVQGDERDVIMISTTYGPDARGNQYQRFGPLNGASGHRRLNVLFTRAKKRVVVFSSLDPDRIQTSANSPWGVRALKQYLIYARTGILQQADDGNDQPTNDFERSIGSVLKEHGYDVVPQVGVAGFFIDLGVKHPTKPGAFLLGIECDGASYHSGRSARDRDRLRQEILENLGWKIYRIWSTDWFRSRKSEIKRLLTHIEGLQEHDLVHSKLSRG